MVFSLCKLIHCNYVFGNYMQTCFLLFCVLLLGANISDYFNYGFDEESWNTYCKKQAKLHTVNRKLYTKIMVR